MKNRNFQSKLLVLAAIFGIFTIYDIGCDISDGDYTDTVQIQRSIQQDAEEAYQVRIVNDKTPGTPSKVSALVPVVFGRIIDTVRTRSTGTVIVDPIEPGDTTAQATVTYTLIGDFRVTDQGLGVTVNKPFEHAVQRNITFAKRHPEKKNNQWVATSISAAYGVSTGGHIVFDTIQIITPTDTFSFSDPSDIIFYDRKPMVFHNNSLIRINVKSYNSASLVDVPVGFVTNGRNRGLERFKGAFTRVLGTAYYTREILINSSGDKFHQLVLDFVTSGTIALNANKPYDSYLIAIPYKVIP